MPNLDTFRSLSHLSRSSNREILTEKEIEEKRTLFNNVYNVMNKDNKLIADSDNRSNLNVSRDEIK